MKLKILTAFGMLTLGVAGLLTACQNTPNLSKITPDFQNKVQSQFEIERHYNQKGTLAVASQTVPANSQLPNIKIWYPDELQNKNQTYPIVIFSNGSNTPYQKYEPIFEHLASYGFVVVGDDVEHAWSGKSTSQILNYLTVQNKSPNSPFKGKLQVNNVGVAGFSQGAIGAVNAVTAFDNSHQFKSLYTASQPQAKITEGFGWKNDLSKVKVPYFLTAGTKLFDAGNPAKDPYSGISPLLSLQDTFKAMPSGQLTVIARRKNADHTDMAIAPNGYMTAWFRYTLMNDELASRAFVGQNPEISQNHQHWQDVVIKH